MTATPNQPVRLITARVCFVQTFALVLLGLAPLPLGWGSARALLDSTRSAELNRADREATAGGYYEGLVGSLDGPQGARSDLLQIQNKPTDIPRVSAAVVTNPLPNGDFLQFELKPNAHMKLFGQPFTTNSYGMRDREYTVEKPEGVYRIAVLGSSIDMGWGLGTEETYVNQLEDGLNFHAAKQGISRRFQVLNFAVHAYSPLQRLEAFRRKARQFQPDMVLYSATMLDIRLMEIHLCDLFRAHADLPLDFLRQAILDSGLTAEDLRTRIHKGEDELVNKEAVKKKLRPLYWSIYDQTLGELAAECRVLKVPLACVIIPRVGKIDAPAVRAESVARIIGMAHHHAIPVYDLSDTFDGQEAAKYQIAPWDDHPNVEGHRRLFKALRKDFVFDPPIYRTLFPTGIENTTAKPTGDHSRIE